MKKVVLVLDNVVAFIYSPFVMVLCAVIDKTLDVFTKIIYSAVMLVITWPFLIWLMYKNRANLKGLSLRSYLFGMLDITRKL